MKQTLTLAILVLAGIAVAQPIPVVNHSFEANFAAPNSFPVLVPTGWQLVDPNSIVDQTMDAVGVLNPTGSTFFPAGAPHGSNVALIFLADNMGQGPVGLRQILNTNLRPVTRYTLRVEVGNIASGYGAPPFNQFFNLDGFPGYRVELRAGGVLLAQDDNSMFGLIPEGEFRTSKVTFTTGKTHPQLGQPLEIRLINRNEIDHPSPGIEVDFDLVRLDATSAIFAPKG
ncbi:MAG: hypothetical protein K1X67_03465 [Fimbriimonadaceae bacterium]|nr:hypothetical protein [Fimbriimonadaceae bacterium]